MKEQLIHAQVEQVNPMTDSILQVMLKPQTFVPYIAGQYLKIALEDQLYSYSIANAPLGARQYELHIRHSRDNSVTQQLVTQLKEKGEVLISLPFGDCHVQQFPQDKPILFIAKGTGFAPIKAMIEQVLADARSQPFELFWSAHSKSDLYMDEKIKSWRSHVRHFQYFSSFTDDKKNTILKQVLARHEKELSQWQIVLSGPFDFVYSLRDALLAKGASEKNFFSDAF